jgi:serine/threonine protein kinase
MSKIHKNINIFNTSYDYNFLKKGLVPLQINEFKNLKSSLGTAVKRNIKIKKDKISTMKVNNNTDKYQKITLIPLLFTKVLRLSSIDKPFHKIGYGSFSDIYSINDKYILKIINKIDDDEIKGLLFNYLLTIYLENLHDSNGNKNDLLKYICKIYELGIIYESNKFENNKLYCIMEKGNIDLYTFFFKQKYINIIKNIKNKVAFLLKLFKECCNALKIIHDLGFVHFDIKLENFLINFRSENDFDIKIIDFGFISKIGDKLVLKGTIYYYNILLIKNVYNKHNGREIDFKKASFIYDIFYLGYMFLEITIKVLFNQQFNLAFPFTTLSNNENVIKYRRSYTNNNFTRNIEFLEDYFKDSNIEGTVKTSLIDLIKKMLIPDRVKRFQNLDTVIKKINEIQEK